MRLHCPETIVQTPQWQYNMSYLGLSWDQGMFGYTLGNTFLAPNPQYPNCRTCTWNGDWDCPGMYGLTSYHPGGGNVAMADGSVRFLKSSTAMQTSCGPWAPGLVGRSSPPTSIDPPRREARRRIDSFFLLGLSISEPDRHGYEDAAHPGSSHSQEWRFPYLCYGRWIATHPGGRKTGATYRAGINVS